MPAPQRHLTLEEQTSLADLAYRLGHNPETRGQFANLVHKIEPNRAKAAFNDVLQEQRFKALERRIDEKLTLSDSAKANAAYEAKKEKLKERYTEEQLKEIEKVKNRIATPDWEAAAIVYAAEHPAPDPTLQPPSVDQRPGAVWEFPTVPGPDGKAMDFKKFAADPRTHSMNTAYNMISEFKRSHLSPGLRS